MSLRNANTSEKQTQRWVNSAPNIFGTGLSRKIVNSKTADTAMEIKKEPRQKKGGGGFFVVSVVPLRFKSLFFRVDEDFTIVLRVSLNILTTWGISSIFYSSVTPSETGCNASIQRERPCNSLVLNPTNTSKSGEFIRTLPSPKGFMFSSP